MTTSRALWIGGLGLVGSVWPLAPWLCSALAGLWLLLVLLGGERVTWAVLGAAVFALSGARSERELGSYLALRHRAEQVVRGSARCEAYVRVQSSPTVKVDPDLDEKAQSLWIGSTNSLSCDGASLPGTWLLRLSAKETEYARGDELLAVLQLGVTQYFQNEGGLDPRPSAARSGAAFSGSVQAVLEFRPATSVPAWIDRLRAHVRSRIFASFRREVIPLARALVLGENDLADEEALAFSKSGLMHILAVSGTHLVFAVVSLERALFALLVRVQKIATRYDVARWSGFLGTGLAFLYADFAGGSGSARRAAYMLALVLGGRALGFRARGSSALGGSVLAGLVLDPLVGFDISFLLSVLATLGLLFVAPVMAAWIQARWSIPGWLSVPLLAMTMTLSSSLLCAPLLAYLGGQMTLAALGANLIAGPAGELLALPACLLHALAGPWPGLERGLAVIGGGALYVVRAAALASASVDALAFQLPSPSAWVTALGLAGALIVSVWRGADRKRRVWIGVLAGVFGVSVGAYGSAGDASSRAGRLVVTALDVGQGDALFVEFPDGHKALMDGGGYPQDRPDVGRRVVLPLLRARAGKGLDLMLLSHADRDHLLGLVDVAREVQVKEFWYPGLNDETPELVRLIELLKRQGTRIVTASELCGRIRNYGAKVEVLAPCGDVAELDRNNGSLVVRLSFGRRSALLTGDVESPGEELLVAAHGAHLQADFLKVAHHGSITSTSVELLENIRPEVAFISLGVRNTFGHPSAEVLGRLEERSVQVFRTDELGALGWATDGEGMWVSNFGDRTWRGVGRGSPPE